jgi:Mg2+/citrate symporter
MHFRIGLNYYSARAVVALNGSGGLTGGIHIPALLDLFKRLFKGWLNGRAKVRF